MVKLHHHRESRLQVPNESYFQNAERPKFPSRDERLSIAKTPEFAIQLYSSATVNLVSLTRIFTAVIETIADPVNTAAD